MTSAGPGPEWLLDPDDNQLERYWNGVAWTEYRRVRTGADRSGQDMGPDFFSAADHHPVGDQSRVPWIASASYAVPVPAADEAQPRTARINLAVGNEATVVAGGDLAGQTGTVVEVRDSGCVVKFSRDHQADHYRFFEFEKLEAATAASEVPAEPPVYTRPPGWRNVSPGYERWWDGTNFVGPVRSFRPRSDGPRWLRRRLRGE